MSHFITRTITAIILTASFLLIIFYLPAIIFSLILATILGYILIYEWPRLFITKPWPGWLLAPLYPIAPTLLLILLNQNSLYHALIFPLFAITASYDTGAYLIGSLWGYHKIVPTISPGKSWEGLLGGYICSMIAVSALSWYAHKNISAIEIICTSLIICALAFLGDLFESWLKRRANIKDTSSILPGHGGFLDRLDGILFVTLFFYLCRDYLIKLL